MVDLEKALGDRGAGRRNQGLVFYPALDSTKLDPAKQYTIAFPHRTLRVIRRSYGNLPNVEAGPRYTAREILAELMKGDYSVTLHTEEISGRTEHAIVGSLRATSANLPSKISLWADASTNIIRRAEFGWGLDNTLSLELTPMEQVPIEWYSHESHHDQQRGVKQIRREKL